MGGNSEVILIHTTNQLHFYKQLLQNFTLDRNIMVYNTINISSKSGFGLVNAEATSTKSRSWQTQLLS